MTFGWIFPWLLIICSRLGMLSQSCPAVISSYDLVAGQPAGAVLYYWLGSLNFVLFNCSIIVMDWSIDLCFLFTPLHHPPPSFLSQLFCPPQSLQFPFPSLSPSSTPSLPLIPLPILPVLSSPQLPLFLIPSPFSTPPYLLLLFPLIHFSSSDAEQLHQSGVPSTLSSCSSY